MNNLEKSKRKRRAKNKRSRKAKRKHKKIRHLFMWVVL